METWGTKFYINGQWLSLAELVEKAAKLDAIKSWWYVFNTTIKSFDAKERLAGVLEIELDDG